MAPTTNNLTILESPWLNGHIHVADPSGALDVNKKPIEHDIRFRDGKARVNDEVLAAAKASPHWGREMGLVGQLATVAGAATLPLVVKSKGETQLKAPRGKSGPVRRTSGRASKPTGAPEPGKTEGEEVQA